MTMNSRTLNGTGRTPNGEAEGARAFEELSGEMGDWVDSLDLQQLSRKVQDFGREKPIALAFTALAIGVAAGLLMRRRS